MRPPNLCRGIYRVGFQVIQKLRRWAGNCHRLGNKQSKPLTVVGGCRLITDFGDGKRNRLMHTSYFRLGNRYFKVAKKCHIETFKHGTFHKTIGSYKHTDSRFVWFFLCVIVKRYIMPYYQITKQK